MLRIVLKTGESIIFDQDGKPLGSITLKKSGSTRATLLIQLPRRIGVWREAIYTPANNSETAVKITDAIEPTEVQT